MSRSRKSGAGWGFVVAVVILLGLIVEYWYVAVPLLAIVVTIGLVHHSKQTRTREEKARHRSGPRDPWLNEIAVALADFEFTEFARNTGTQLAGVPIEGDIRLDAPRFSVVITLLGTAELAHQAEMALRAKPDVRTAILDGKTVVRCDGRVLYTANGRGNVVDEARLNEVAQIVDGVPIGLPQVPPTVGASPLVQAPPVPQPAVPPRQAPRAPRAAPAVPQPSADALDQIKRLAELRGAGALTEAEFEAKKTELLRRL